MSSKTRTVNEKDLAAGLIYIAAGAAFGIGAFNYKIGEAARMGPGWFPMAVGFLLVAVGLVTVASAVHKRASADALKRPELRSMAWILGAVTLFGLMLQPAGLVIALLVLVIVSSMASHEFKLVPTLLNAVVLTAFSIGVFIKGIDLQIGLWPAFLG